jgi:uncharacterized protein (TIGR00730 family)
VEKSPNPLCDTRNICVYAGANTGSDPIYVKAATALGQVLAQRGYGLVYGGGRTGLMGAIADSVLAAGGTVIGVIPERLATKELAHAGVTRLEVVHTMHERKHRMATLANAFIALPGGIGTFEELLEAATWTQLRIHHKPVALYNVLGFYDRLVEFLEHASQERFIRPAYSTLLLADADPQQLVSKLEAWQYPKENP